MITVLSPPLTRRLPSRRLPTSRAYSRRRRVIDPRLGSRSGAEMVLVPVPSPDGNSPDRPRPGSAQSKHQSDGPGRQTRHRERTRQGSIRPPQAGMAARPHPAHRADRHRKDNDRYLPALAAALGDVRSALNRPPRLTPSTLFVDHPRPGPVSTTGGGIPPQASTKPWTSQQPPGSRPLITAPTSAAELEAPGAPNVAVTSGRISGEQP